MKVILYSTHCPRCNVLEEKLEDEDIEYTIVEDQSIMQEKLLQKITMEIKLSKAINDRYFNLYFQPQYNIKTNKLRGFIFQKL